MTAVCNGEGVAGVLALWRDLNDAARPSGGIIAYGQAPHQAAEAACQGYAMSMRERAALVGGRLDIESAADRGSSIDVRIPRSEPEA